MQNLKFSNYRPEVLKTTIAITFTSHATTCEQTHLTLTFLAELFHKILSKLACSTATISVNMAMSMIATTTRKNSAAGSEISHSRACLYAIRLYYRGFVYDTIIVYVQYTDTSYACVHG